MKPGVSSPLFEELAQRERDRAPTLFFRRPIRSIPVSSGYVDSFSDLPLDVDGDGFTDVIQIDYGSKAGGGLQMAVRDIDGDGDMDLVSGGKSGLFLAVSLVQHKRD